MRVVAGIMAVVVVVGMAPVPAFGAQVAQASAGALVAQVKNAVRVESIDAHADDFVAGEFIVGYRDDAQIEVREVEPGQSVGQAVVAAEDDPDVAYAQPNYVYRPFEGVAGADSDAMAVAGVTAAQATLAPLAVAVDDEYANNAVNNKAIPNQWWLSSVRAQDAWEYAKCDNEVTVAVLDTGINFEHVDLSPNILVDYAWDATAEGIGAPLTESPTTSALSHGSHVAGIAAARANNGAGIAGASYNANILPICVFTAAGGQASCDDADLVKAYDYLLSDADGDGRTVAQETNTRVVNMSLGGYGASGASDEALHAAIVRAEEAGILTVAAGGNGDGYGNPRTDESYPSDFDEVMSVIALESDNQRVEWSDYNSHKDIAAPGVNIWSTWWTGNEYECESGTSMASPLVAGCAALLWAYDPELSVAQVKDALYSTAADLGTAGKDDYYGWGRIDVAAALESLGTAHITAERTTMGRTGTQTLTATDVADPALAHTWHWSVPIGSDVVAVGERTGVVSALKAGSAVVHVEAEDNPEVAGNISLTVTEITVPGAITVEADGVNHRMNLKWRAADAAVLYRVMRSTALAGAFSQVAEVPAQASARSCTYSDADVEVATDYYYKVVPVGQLDGAYFEGMPTDVAGGFFTDKTVLSAHIEAAEGAISSAIVSATGRDVDQTARWTTQANLDKLKSTLSVSRRVFASARAKQATVDTAARNLAAANTAYQSALKTGTKPIALAKGDVAVAAGTYTYTGAAITPRVTVTHGGKTLSEKTHYTLSWSGNVGAGTAKVTVTGVGLYSGSQAATFTIGQAANSLAVRAKSTSVKRSAKKNTSIAAKKVLAVSGAQGAVTYTRVAKGSSKWLSKVNKKTGAITLKKGAPRKKTLSVKVKVSAAGAGNYLAASKTVTVKVKVK